MKNFIFKCIWWFKSVIIRLKFPCYPKVKQIIMQGLQIIIADFVHGIVSTFSESHDLRHRDSAVI